ncbi:hypothetical protein Hsw_2131 [Hymenobacter swuensis DY53]|uniref:Uncharacterized protein n=1 Tax=Hymenobacter swuensis DY53 TaxID=1227739 RepID=W8F534_9BACT|nr:hypothetical protein Hsw_2131 [Hymenobacter swuensis DY53]
MLQNYGIVTPGNASLQVIFFRPVFPAVHLSPNGCYTTPFWEPLLDRPGSATN